jgi:prevent-host-death family protein
MTKVISEFKAKCIAILKEVNRTGESLTVTLRGKPLGTIEPMSVEERTFGAQKEATKTRGDIVHFDFRNEWEANS